MKAGERHETVRQPELICSAHRVTDAEIVYTGSQSFSPRVRRHLRAHACVHVLVAPGPYVHMYATVHTLVFICVPVCAPSAKVSHLPAPALGTLTPNLQSLSPPASLAPHLSIHLTEGFTLLTVKFTHIHNYVFNQSHLKASRMQPFFGSGRRSRSALRGLSRLTPVSALCTND